MVISDVDGCSKTLNHRKILRETQESNTQLKTKRILKPKCKLSGVLFLYLACQGGEDAPLRQGSYATAEWL